MMDSQSGLTDYSTSSDVADILCSCFGHSPSPGSCFSYELGV
jgi:hypothetical protein